MLPIDDGVGQGLELFAMELAVQTGPRGTGVRQGDLTALLDRARRGDAQQRTFELGSTRERGRSLYAQSGRRRAGASLPGATSQRQGPRNRHLFR